MDTLLCFLKKLTLDQKIQAAILATLLLTLAVGMFFELLRLRKSIRFLHLEDFYAQDTQFNPYTRLAVEVANTSRRPINLRSQYLETQDGRRLGERSTYLESSLSEGDSVRLELVAHEVLAKEEIRLVGVIDSSGKNYSSYLYNGRFRSRWTILFLRFWESGFLD